MQKNGVHSHTSFSHYLGYAKVRQRQQRSRSVLDSICYRTSVVVRVQYVPVVWIHDVKDTEYISKAAVLNMDRYV